MIYRKICGETGYVFQSRYKSTLIQDDKYLRMAIKYTLSNPVRAGLVTKFYDYLWSSANDYYSEKRSGIIDAQFVEELFSSKKDFLGFLELNPNTDWHPRQTKYGEILGDKKFEKTAIKKFNRRKNNPSFGFKRMNDQDPIFDPVEKVIWEFEKKIGIPIENIDISSFEGKRIRGELLIRLKDTAGLKYIEIIRFPPFENLKLQSLGKLYKDAKNRLKK